jgi:outer membrane protein assembly factor BamB
MTNFPGINSTPLLYGDLGYIIDGLGKLYCFSVKDGSVQWTKDVFKDFDGVNNKYGITENFLVEGEKLFCTPGGKKNNVIALNRFNGDLIWTSPGEGQASAYCSPTIIKHNEQRYLITATDSAILSINPDNGKLAWSFNLGANWGTKANMPIYKNGNLFIPTGSKTGSRMLKIADNGNSVIEVWNSFYLNRNMGEVVVLDDAIYGTHNRKKKLFKLDWNTGNALESLKLKQASSLISDGKMIYSYDIAGNVQLIKDNNEGLESVSSFEFELDSISERRVFHCSYQVIKDGRLYVRCDNILRVYNIAKS